jgi:hypothetical protein
MPFISQIFIMGLLSTASCCRWRAGAGAENVWYGKKVCSNCVARTTFKFEKYRYRRLILLGLQVSRVRTVGVDEIVAVDLLPVATV